MEATFRGTEGCARAILDGTLDAFIGVNLLNVVVTVNPGAAAVFAVPAAAMLGRRVNDSGLPEPLRRCIVESVRRAKAGESVEERASKSKAYAPTGGRWWRVLMSFPSAPTRKP